LPWFALTSTCLLASLPTQTDEGGLDGDLAATVTAAGKAAVAVVWPTAEKLPLLKELAEV
jgi:hypothetical protein